MEKTMARSQAFGILATFSVALATAVACAGSAHAGTFEEDRELLQFSLKQVRADALRAKQFPRRQSPEEAKKEADRYEAKEQLLEELIDRLSSSDPAGYSHGLQKILEKRRQNNAGNDAEVAALLEVMKDFNVAQDFYRKRKFDQDGHPYVSHASANLPLTVERIYPSRFKLPPGWFEKLKAGSGNPAPAAAQAPAAAPQDSCPGGVCRIPRRSNSSAYSDSIETNPAL